MATAKVKSKPLPSKSPPAPAPPAPTPATKPSAEIRPVQALKVMSPGGEGSPGAAPRARTARSVQAELGNQRLGRLAGGEVRAASGADALASDRDINIRPELTDPGPELRFRELDVNPARGAMQRAQMLAQRPAVGKEPHSADEGWGALFNALLDALERADRSLTSDAKLSSGLHEWAEGTSSEGSTAAKPTKDVVYLSSTGIDLTEVFEIMDVLVLSVSTKKEMFTAPEDFKEKPLEVIFDLKQKVDAIEKSYDEEEKKKKAKEESRERSAQELQLLQEIRELKKLVKVDLAELKAAEGKLASVENETTAAGKHAGQAPREVKAPSPKTAKPAGYDRDPMGYWNSYPQVASFEGISGDPYSTGGAVAIITDKHGTKRMFRYWFDKDGYERSEFLRAPTQ